MIGSIQQEDSEGGQPACAWSERILPSGVPFFKSEMRAVLGSVFTTSRM